LVLAVEGRGAVDVDLVVIAEGGKAVAVVEVHVGTVVYSFRSCK